MHTRASELASECHQALRAHKTDHLASGEYVQAFTDPTTAFGKTDWSLVLVRAPIVSSLVIDLRDPEIERVPLPDSSLPIRISMIFSTTTTTRWCGHCHCHRHHRQKFDTRADHTHFPHFDDRLGNMPSRTPLMQIKETVSFDLDIVMKFYL